MKHIDKSGFEAEGKDIVDDLLKEAWNEIEGRYIEASYSGFNSAYKERLNELLLREQSRLCCYCLKEIKSQNLTIEHLIPQQIETAQILHYFSAGELEDNVIHKDDFDWNSNLIPPIKYPHDIAWHNLLASCNSNYHCNHYRGNELIKPFIFDSEIEQKTSYDAHGLVDCEEYQNDFDKLGLNSDEKLIIIRRIWRNIAPQISGTNQLTIDFIEEQIVSMVDDPDYLRILDDFFEEPSKKELLLEYKWFYEFYR